MKFVFKKNNQYRMFKKIKNKNNSTFFLIIARESNSVDEHRKLQ